MRALLGLAALAVIAPLSQAQTQTASFGATNASPWVTTVPQAGPHHGDTHHGGERMRGHVHYGFAGNYAAYGYAGYNDYGDFDGNRGFDPDKWNDWWHDRPERAYPHWMSNNADCARRWYAGDVLTC